MIDLENSRVDRRRSMAEGVKELKIKGAPAPSQPNAGTSCTQLVECLEKAARELFSA